MEVRNARVEYGRFDSIPIMGDREHRLTAGAFGIIWEWRADGSMPWRTERLHIASQTRWDGSSRPDAVGWLIPRWGVFSLASLIHDECFRNGPHLSDGNRISRKHADLLFLALMRTSAEERVTTGWKAPAQLAMADVMYKAVSWFGAPTWNRHEFRGGAEN